MYVVQTSEGVVNRREETLTYRPDVVGEPCRSFPD
jgi:hypothetical protein